MFGSNQRSYPCPDLMSFDGLIDTVEAVGIAVPASGMFAEAIKYLLVVATTPEIVILGLAYDNVQRDYSLVPTKFVVPCEDLQVAGIEGTQDGRIFVAGIDGSVYQLAYDSEKGWDSYLPFGLRFNLRPKCRKIHHNPWPLDMMFMVTPWMSLTGSQSFVDMKCDNYRKLLHVASAEGFLRTFSLSSSQPEYCCTSELFPLMRDYLERQYGQAFFPPSETLFVVSISVLPPTESKIAHLMMALNDGCRIFLSMKQGSDGRPRSSSVCGIRSPPPKETINKATSPLPFMEAVLQVEQCYHCHGVTVLDAHAHGQQIIIGLAEDLTTHQDILNQERSYQEGVCVLQHPELSKAKVHDICEESHMLDDECLRELSAMAYSAKSGAWIPAPPLVLAADSRSPKTWGAPTDIIPLGELSMQHLNPMRRVLVLTTSGLLVFVKRRPIDYLLKTLSRDSSADTLRDMCAAFKDDFGDKNAQVAAMCFALACGVPHDVFTSSGVAHLLLDDRFKRNIISSMLEISTPPQYQQAQTTHATHDQQTHSQPANVDVDTAVTTLFEFGSAHEGLVLFLSRILRPVWHRTAVKVDPTQPLKAKYTLSQKHITKLISPLQALRNILRLSFEDSIRRPNPQNDVAALSRQQKSINRIYRLIGRIIQCLSMLDLLLTATKAHSLPIKLAAVSKFTFKELVTSQQAHAKLQVILCALVRPSKGTKTEVAADLARELSSRCFFFFNEGELLSKDAKTRLEEASELPYGDSDRDRLVREAVRLLCRAAEYWRSRELVNSSSSTLTSTCEYLFNIRAYTGLVDVGLSCSANFSPSGMSILENKARDQHTYAWEKGLYHNSPMEEDFDACRRHCYDIIIQSIHDLAHPYERVPKIANTELTNKNFTIGPDVIREVISHALRLCKDEEFHWKLYQYLLQEDQNLLLCLNGELVERFLMENGSAMQQYEYATSRGHDEKAYQLMDRVAHAEDNGLALLERIDCLRKAKESASRCLLPDKATDMEFSIKLAHLQILTLEGLRSLRDYLQRGRQTQHRQLIQRLDQCVARLSSGLLKVSELYNDYAGKYCLWDVCLRITHISNHEDSSNIENLWKNYIYGFVPLSTTNPDISEWLAQKTSYRDIRGDNKIQFEQLTWPSTLKRKIEALANHVAKGSAAFPLAYLVDELEELAYKHNSRHPSSDSLWPWPAEVLYDITSPLQLSEAYLFVITRIEGLGQDPRRLLRLVYSMVWVLEQWVTQADLEAQERDQGQRGLASSDLNPNPLSLTYEPALRQSVRVGQWGRWLQYLTSAANTLHGPSQLLAEMKRRIDGLKEEGNKRKLE